MQHAWPWRCSQCVKPCKSSHNKHRIRCQNFFLKKALEGRSGLRTLSSDLEICLALAVSCCLGAARFETETVSWQAAIPTMQPHGELGRDICSIQQEAVSEGRGSSTADECISLTVQNQFDVVGQLAYLFLKLYTQEDKNFNCFPNNWNFALERARTPLLACLFPRTCFLLQRSAMPR